MADLTEDQWQFVDEMLFIDWTLEAIRFVRGSLHCDLREAMDIVYLRKAKLGLDFGGQALSRVTAFASLDKIAEDICVIEGYWDEDDSGLFVRLSAITKQPSKKPCHEWHG